MSRIPLSCADFTFPLIPHSLALDLIAGLGMDGVDVSLMNLKFMEGTYPHLPVEKVLANPSSWAKELSAKLSSRNLQLADILFIPGKDYSSRSINHPDASVRKESAEWFQRALEFSVRCNAKHLTILPGVPWPEEDTESSLKRSGEELAGRVEEASKVGIVLSVEPHVGSIIPTPADTQRLLQLAPQLTLTLDYCHFVCQGFSDSDCEGLLPHATHFHVRGGCNGRLQASMSDNTIDYRRVIQLMKQLNYRGYLTLEYAWDEVEDGCNDVDNLSETVISRDLVNQFR